MVQEKLMTCIFHQPRKDEFSRFFSITAVAMETRKILSMPYQLNLLSLLSPPSKFGVMGCDHSRVTSKEA